MIPPSRRECVCSWKCYSSEDQHQHYSYRVRTFWPDIETVVGALILLCLGVKIRRGLVWGETFNNRVLPKIEVQSCVWARSCLYTSGDFHFCLNKQNHYDWRSFFLTALYLWGQEEVDGVDPSCIRVHCSIRCQLIEGAPGEHLEVWRLAQGYRGSVLKVFW